MSTRPELPEVNDGAGNGRPWDEKVRGWLTSLATDVDSVLPGAAPYVQGESGIRKIRLITQAAYTSPPQVTLDAYKAVVAKYPSIKGGFIWEQRPEGQTNWQWTRLTGRYIRGL